jgi:hypothetical protein
MRKASSEEKTFCKARQFIRVVRSALDVIYFPRFPFYYSIAIYKLHSIIFDYKKGRRLYSSQRPSFIVLD